MRMQDPDHDYSADFADPNELTPQRLLGAIGVGSAGALLGALIWAAIVVLAGVESGFIALIIGGLVGGGVSMGSQRARGVQLQIIAASIALAGYAGAKLIIIAWVFQRSTGQLPGPGDLGVLSQAFMQLLSFWDLLWGGIAVYMAASMLKNDAVVD